MSLHIQALRFERNQQLLFDQLTMTLARGDYLQIQGANGSGKSTLLRLLAGLLTVTEGDILWQQQSIRDLRDTYQQVLHYLGHLHGNKPLLTVIENLHLAALHCATKNVMDEAVILKTIGLTAEKHQLAATLSAGQMRRLAIGRLLLAKRPLWILDEPMTALDAKGIAMLRELIEQHLAQGGIAIIATHEVYRFHNARNHLCWVL